MRTKIIIILILLAAGGGVWFGFFGKPDEMVMNRKEQVPNMPLEDYIGKTLKENQDVFEQDKDGQEENPAQNEDETQAEQPGEEKQKEENSDEEIAGACTGADEANYDCYEKLYQNLVATKGIDAAMDDLRARYPESPYVRSQCHPLTHVVGRAAAKKFGTVAEAYKNGDGFCWSGYYHGILETVIDEIGYQNLIAEINSICAPMAAENKYGFDHYNCVHGLGHGVMAITNTELFQSLKLCDNLVDHWDRSSCWSGVYMENVIVDGLNHITKYLKSEDPLYPCNAVDQQYKGICYLMQTSYMLKVRNGDFAAVFKLCSEADPGYENTCYQSLGRDASGRSVSNIAQTKEWCNLGTTYEQRENCIIGAVKDFVAYHHSDVQAKQFCRALDEEGIKQTCLTTAESYYSIF